MSWYNREDDIDPDVDYQCDSCDEKYAKLERCAEIVQVLVNMLYSHTDINAEVIDSEMDDLCDILEVKYPKEALGLYFSKILKNEAALCQKAA